MTQSNSDFLAEITRFLQADELGTGFSVDAARILPPIVVPGDLSRTAADHVWSSSSSEEEQPTSSRMEGTEPPIIDGRVITTKRPKCYWERMKQEREALRYEESQLSKRLAVLMHNFKEKNDRRTSDTNCISTWKTIALCLQAERQHAEDERYQLQVAVESQSFFIQQFYALVVKQLGDRNLVCDLAAQQCEIEQRKDGLIFTAHVAELDVNYACTDNIFSATDRVFMGERISVNPDGTTKCLQSRIKHNYPFDFYHSRDSIWELFRTYNHQKDREPYSGVANPDSTYAFKFRVSTQLTTLVVRIAIRRYLTDNQMVMVWRTFTEGEGSFSGMHCSESGWIRVRPCETGTTIEMYVKLIPVGFSSTTTRFYDAVSLFRQVAQDHEARILYALGTFPIDKMSTI